MAPFFSRSSGQQPQQDQRYQYQYNQEAPYSQRYGSESAVLPRGLQPGRVHATISKDTTNRQAMDAAKLRTALDPRSRPAAQSQPAQFTSDPPPVLYRIQCPSAKQILTFFDKPTLINNYGHAHAFSTQPVRSESAFESQLTSSSFVIYRTYACQNVRSMQLAMIQEEIRITDDRLKSLLDKLIRSHRALKALQSQGVFDRSSIRGGYNFYKQYSREIEDFVRRERSNDLSRLFHYIHTQS